MKKIIPIILLALILLAGFIIADNNCIPNMNSNEYHGTAFYKLDGEYVPMMGDYTLIAMIGDNIVGSTKIKFDGSYAIDVSPCPEIISGKIYFIVGDVEANESGEYEYEPSPIEIPLDLHFNKNPQAVCGNGEINKGEECDDENIDSGDGCSSICEVELGYFCDSGAPSVCTEDEDDDDTSPSNNNDNPPSGGSPGGSSPSTTTPLSSPTTTAINTQGNETINASKNQQPINPGITGGVIGFAKSPTGIGLVIGSLILIAGIVVVNLKKRKLGKKNPEKEVEKKVEED